MKLLRQSKLARKEIYVFTDLSRGAWPAEQAARLQQQLGRAERPGHLRDRRGRRQPDQLRPGRGAALRRGALEPQHADDRDRAVVRRRRRRRGSSNCTCWTPTGKPQKRERAKLRGHAGRVAAGRVPRRRAGAGHAPGLRADRRPGRAGGRRHAVLHRRGEAGLARAGGRAAAGRKATRCSSPRRWPRTAFRKRGQARFDCDICDLGELAKRPLADYAAVCLLDPTPLEPAMWKKLADFAADGHGVAIFLGRNALPIDSFNEPQAQELLPGKLLRQARRPDGDCTWPRAITSTRSWRPSAARPARSPGTPFPCSAIGNSTRRRPAWAWCCPTTTAGRRCWSGPSARAAC